MTRMDHLKSDVLYFLSTCRASRLLKWLAPGMRFMSILTVAYTSSCAKFLPYKGVSTKTMPRLICNYI